MSNPALAQAEFLSRSELDRIQRARWKNQVAYLRAQSGFYQAGARHGNLPDELGALADVAFTDKAMLRADQAAHPPFGSYLASAASRVSRIHRTSGTTGQAMNLALSRADAEMTASVGARAQSASGLGPGHRVVHCLNYQMWMGGYTDHAALEATGATVIPFGVGGSEQLVRVIRELGVTAISCTPSYPAVLKQVLQTSFSDLSPRDLGLQLGLFGGEPGLDDPNFRARLEEDWGFRARNANYGVSDVLCNFAGQTDINNDLHFVAEDVLLPEIIDPDSGQRLPFREGETGELVLTHLAKECQPLVRFRTGDIIQLTGTGTAACGRTAPRFRVVGRSDDMVVVRGINLFPSMVSGVVNQFEALSGEYRIPLRSAPPYDVLPLEVELRATAGGAVGELAQRVADGIKQQLGARAEVVALPAGSLPRTEGKTPRVIRYHE